MTKEYRFISNQQYISMCHDNTCSPDILFLTIPPVYDLKETEIPKDQLNTTIDQHPNTGLAFLATQITLRTNYIPAICYGHQARIKNRNGEKKYYFDVDTLSRLCIASNAKIIGLSLMSPMELKFSKSLIDKIHRLANSLGRNVPVFIAGGAQATLDRKRTSAKLNINIKNVIPGRAIKDLLKRLDKILGGTSYSIKIDYSAPVITEFLRIYNDNEPTLQITPNVNILSSGGRGCVGNRACSFCTAYFLGKKEYIPENNFFLQTDKFADCGIKSMLASDNAINLSKPIVYNTFLRRVEYAFNKNVPIRHFLSRPDFIAKTSLEYLIKLKALSVQTVLLGVESGNADTLRAMKKPIKNGFEEKFKESCRIAAKKLFLAGIKPTFSVIVGYPVEGINGEKADKDTLAFLNELIRLSRYKAKAEIHLLHLAPKSEIYTKLLKRGANPDSLDDCNYENEIEYRKFKNKFEEDTGLVFEEQIFNWNESFIKEFLTFLFKRRESLNGLLIKKYRF